MIDTNSEDKRRSTSFESIDLLISRWRNGTFGEILDAATREP